MDNFTQKSKLVCRKCGGNHLTIKCGKPKKTPIEVKKNSYKKGSYKKGSYKKDDSKGRRNHRRNYDDGINKIKVKISNLPDDIDVRELNTLMQPWGKIGRISINKRYNCYSIIDFYKIEEAEYFVKALDKTGFSHRILNVTILKNRF